MRGQRGIPGVPETPPPRVQASTPRVGQIRQPLRRPVSAASPRRISTGVMVLADDRAAELFEVRAPLEGLVAALAAQRHSPAQLAAIEDVVEAGRRHLDAGEVTPLPELNTRFHQLLVATAGNAQLAGIM